METVFEKIIDDALFQKDSWFKKLLRRFRFKFACCLNSSCSLEPEEVVNDKQLQKDEIMDFIKTMNMDYKMRKPSITAQTENIDDLEEKELNYLNLTNI